MVRSGEFGVLADHINFITSLVPGIVQVNMPEGGYIQTWVVSGGLAEVKDGEMTILADSAEEPRLIDLTGVEGMLRELELQIAELSMYEEGYDLKQHDLLLARARQRAATELRASR